MAALRSNLLVVGSVALDSVEAPAGRHDDILGGSASFFTVAASYFVRPKLVGIVERIGEARAADLLDAKAQAKALATASELVLDPRGGAFRQGDSHRSITFEIK